MTAVPASSRVLVDAPAMTKPSATPAADMMPSLTSTTDSWACERRRSSWSLTTWPRTQFINVLNHSRRRSQGGGGGAQGRHPRRHRGAPDAGGPGHRVDLAVGRRPGQRPDCDLAV